MQDLNHLQYGAFGLEEFRDLLGFTGLGGWGFWGLGLSKEFGVWGCDGF